MFRHRLAVIVFSAAVLCGCQSASSQANDPPARVGRVSAVTGAVSFLPVGENDWSAASLNYPLTTGDALWSDAGARAEIHIGASTVSIAPSTSLALDAIEDSLVQLRVGQGAIHIRLRELGPYDSYEIDTPSGTVVLQAIGEYRIDVTPDGRRAIVTVRDGDADVYVGDQTYRVPSGSSLTLIGGTAQPIAASQVVAPDSWESWARSRDQQEDAVASTRYVSRDMVGYEDLDQYGDWQADATYGAVWYPRSVQADWAPYRSGRWESVEPWGWTWIDDNPWGFAPFHYGRWSHDRGRWGWIPGSMQSRPVYAPALVAFVSGAGWSASVSFGSGGGVGWVPLAPNEPYVPGYRASAGYVRNVNQGNVNGSRVDVSRVNVSTVQYANRNVPGAVTAVPRAAFEGSRPVGNAAVRLQPADLAAARVSAAPIAAGVTIAPPPRGAPRPQQNNAVPVQRPPAELSRAAAPPVRATGRGNQRPPAVAPPSVPNQPPTRGGGRGNQVPPVTPPPVTPPPVVPMQPPTQRGGRGNQVPPVTQPPVTPPPVVPTQPPTQRGNRGNRVPPVTPPPVTPPPAVPTPPPTRGGGGGNPTTPVKPTPVTPPPTVPTQPPTQRGRGNRVPPVTPPPVTPPPAIPPPARGGGRSNPATPVRPTPVTPPPTVPKPVPVQGRGRGAPPDTGRGGKPPKGKPDSGRSGGEVMEIPLMFDDGSAVTL